MVIDEMFLSLEYSQYLITLIHHYALIHLNSHRLFNTFYTFYLRKQKYAQKLEGRCQREKTEGDTEVGRKGEREKWDYPHILFAPVEEVLDLSLIWISLMDLHDITSNWNPSFYITCHFRIILSHLGTGIFLVLFSFVLFSSLLFLQATSISVSPICSFS